VRRGFTLLEILVAMSLLFVVLATVYASFETHVRGMERAREVQRQAQVARLALNMLARDLQSAYWDPRSVSEDEATLEEQDDEDEEVAVPAIAPQSEEDPEVLFLVQPIREDGRPWDRIAFLTVAPFWSPVATSYPWVHAVEYRLAREVESRRPVLVRRENPTPGRDLLAGGEEWVLADDVLGLEILCLDQAGQTASSWDSRVKRNLPRSVLVKLWMADPARPGEEPTPYTLHALLPPSGDGQEETSP
jgi:prepilin-type N-terminal cleavage/methylation domain-containing protein